MNALATTAQFLNSEIKTKGGSATPLNVKIDNAVIDITSNIEVIGDTIEGKLDTMVTGAVKKIIRGTATGSGTATQMSISISTVVSSKCLVILDNSLSAVGSDQYHETKAAYLISLSSNTLTIGTNHIFTGMGVVTKQSPISWQIIEFY